MVLILGYRGLVEMRAADRLGIASGILFIFIHSSDGILTVPGSVFTLKAHVFSFFLLSPISSHGST